MSPETIERLDKKLSESPILSATELPSEDDVAAAEKRIGIPFAQDYREFLLRYGGAMVGPYPIFGLRPVEVMGVRRWSVVEMTSWFRESGVEEISHWVVVSEDHAGNPVGIDSAGKVWIFDHDFGGVHPEAEDFEAYVLSKCLGHSS